LELLYTIDTSHLLVVHLEAFTLDHDMNAAIPEPAALFRNPLDRITQVCAFRLASGIAIFWSSHPAA
jgi:hypothetical protein